MEIKDCDSLSADSLSSQGLCQVSLGSWVLILKQNFDLLVNDEPHFGLSLLYHPASQQYIFRVLGRTFESGKVVSHVDLLEKCQELFFTGKVCIGFMKTNRSFPLSCKFANDCLMLVPSSEKTLAMCRNCRKMTKPLQNQPQETEWDDPDEPPDRNMWMKTANDAPSSLNSRQIITPLKFEMGMKDADYSSRTIIKLEGENEPLDLYDILESGSDLNENIVMEENPLGPKCSRTQEQELNGDSMTGRKSYYECSSCHQTFIDFESIRVHKAVYHQDGFAFGSGDPMSFQELQNQEKTLSSIVQTTVHSHNVSQANIESVDVKRHTNRNQATSDQLSCPICALTCATMSTLKVHLLLHEVPHIVCRTCGQKFQTQSKLINHKRTHTREKRFACDLCDYRTGRGDTLTCHKKYVHLGIPRPKKRPRK